MHSCISLWTRRDSPLATCARTIQKLSGFAFLTAMALFLWSGANASASDEVPIHFQNGTPPDGAWPVIERWMRAQDEDPPYNFDLLQDHLDRTVKFGWAKNTDEALVDFLSHELFWAYVDLDGDGIDEMMVFIAIGPYCGTAGCSTSSFTEAKPDGESKTA